MASFGAESASARIPLHQKGFDCVDGNLNQQHPAGQDKLSQRKKLTVCCSITFALGAAMIIGFFFVGPLIKSSLLASKATRPNHLQGSSKFMHGIQFMPMSPVARPMAMSPAAMRPPQQASVVTSMIPVASGDVRSELAEVAELQAEVAELEQVIEKKDANQPGMKTGLISALLAVIGIGGIALNAVSESFGSNGNGTPARSRLAAVTMSANDTPGNSLLANSPISRSGVPMMKLSEDPPPQSLVEEFGEMLYVTSNLKMATGDLSSRRGFIIGGLGGLVGLAASPMLAYAADFTPWATKTLIDAINDGKVIKVIFSEDGRQVKCFDEDGKGYESLILPEQSAQIIATLKKKDIIFTVQPPQNNGPNGAGGLGGILGGLLNLAFPLFLLSLLSRGGGGMGAGGPMGGMGGMGNVGKSKSKIEMEPDTGVSFADVAGQDGAKLELTEVVDFLKEPEKYSALGAKIPKGCVMEGPPGTGKTLLARAVAGEAGVPFVSASGSEFVEMFVGVGASRVRDLFEQAKKNAPCIVFIDEIDAIGGKRAGGGGGMGGGNDEREQTLNQILTEMDGFEGNTGVIVLAATNRADTLDPALIRPGRFDRRVPVELPDVKGRFDILKVHVKDKPLSAEVDLGIIAKRTTGFSGASLANLMNEAAIVAARNEKKEIGYNEIDYAIDRQTVGMQKTTGMTFPARQKLVAYHEAGHAVAGLMTPDYDMVTKVTIIPRTNGAGGFTLFTPTEERMESGMYSKTYLKGQLAVALGGRVAEEMILGKDGVTTGASNDLQQVRNIARRMVTQWGFAEQNMGNAPVAWEEPESRGLMSAKTASMETEMEIDEQVKIIVNEAWRNCIKILSDNRALLDAISERLIQEETVDYMQLQEMRTQYGGNPNQLSAEELPSITGVGAIA